MNRCENHITEHQIAILKFISVYAQEHGYPPTLDEIGGENSSTAQAAKKSINKLAEKGMVTFIPNQPRSIQLTDKAREVIDRG